MKKIKRSIALVLVIILCLSSLCVTPIWATEVKTGSSPEFSKVNSYISGQFSDVKESQWYSQGVQTAYEYGLMTGTGDTLFSPDGNLTVAEAIAIASRLHSLSIGSNASFTSGSPWYQPYVDYALKNKIINAQYSYNNPINRADFALFINNALAEQSLEVINYIKETDIPGVFPGVPMDVATGVLLFNGVLATEDSILLSALRLFFNEQMGEYNTAKETDNAIFRLYRAGIVTGIDEYGTYAPEANLTRAAAASIISRVVDPSLRQHVTLVQKPVTLVPLENLANLPSVQEKASRNELALAYQEAKKIVEPLSTMSREAQLSGIALAIRVRTEKNITYSMSDPHYADPYGFFVKGVASCAGAVRATGLCLNMLGIPYEHVNENKYSHQWVRVNVNGTYWICDAFGLYCGPELVPYAHPNF